MQGLNRHGNLCYQKGFHWCKGCRKYRPWDGPGSACPVCGTELRWNARTPTAGVVAKKVVVLTFLSGGLYMVKKAS